MVTRGRHPKNEINAAFKTLDPQRFDVVDSKNGHTWGFVVCRVCGARHRVWGTPKNPGNDAHHIRQFAAKHQHDKEE